MPLKSLSFGYGLHSRIEPLNIYFASTPNAISTQANKDLKLSKAHHFVLAYDWNISEILHLKIEPYFQYLFDVPIVANTTTSPSGGGVNVASNGEVTADGDQENNANNAAAGDSTDALYMTRNF